MKELEADIALIDIPEVRAEIEREEAEYRAQVMRDLCTTLGFATVCRGKRCKRLKRCEGDTDVCFPLYWPLVRGNMDLVAYAQIKTNCAGFARPEITAEINRRLGLPKDAPPLASSRRFRAG